MITLLTSHLFSGWIWVCFALAAVLQARVRPPANHEPVTDLDHLQAIVMTAVVLYVAFQPPIVVFAIAYAVVRASASLSHWLQQKRIPVPAPIQTPPAQEGVRTRRGSLARHQRAAQ